LTVLVFDYSCAAAVPASDMERTMGRIRRIRFMAYTPSLARIQKCDARLLIHL
jgi:hypothetical protein